MAEQKRASTDRLLGEADSSVGSSSAPVPQASDAELGKHGGPVVSGESSQHQDTDRRGNTSAITNRPHGRHKLELVEDIYLDNPEILIRQDLRAGLTHEPWPVETEARVRLLVEQVTEPPRVGLFERIDFGYDLRMYMEGSSTTVRMRWDRLLACYDIAMRGRNLALSALADASNRSYEGEELEKQSQEAMRMLAKENEDLTRAIEYVESQNRNQEKQIATLEERNRTLAREGFIRRARYDKALGVLEAMLADWEGGTGVPISRPTAGATGDQEARFEAIRQGLEEVRMASAMSNTRYRQLQHKYDALLQESAEPSQGQPSQEISPFPISDPGSEPTLRKREDDMLSNDPEENRAHLDLRMTSQSGLQPWHQDEEGDRLREEIALWRSRCADLKWTVDQLEQRLARQGLEAAYDEKSDRTSMSKVEDSTRFLSGTGTGAVRPLADELGTALSSQSSQLSLPPRDVIHDIEAAQLQDIHPSQGSQPSLLPRDVIRDIEAAQLQTIQSSQGVMDEIKATIDELVKRVSTEMAEAKELHRLEARQILEELQKLSLSADAWSREHQKLEENHGLIHGELDALQRMVQLNEQQQQRSRVGLAQSASEQRNGSRSVSTITRSTSSSYEPSVILSFAASAHEIRHLSLVRVLIQAMGAPPSQNQMGLDTAVSMWLNHLYYLRHELNSVDPNTPTEDLMTKFGAELETLLSYGIEKDPRPYYSTIEHYDKLFFCLQELGSYVPKPSVSEKRLLENIRDSISAAEEAQETHGRLEREHETWRAQHPRLPLTSSQFGEVLRLASNFLEVTGSDWNRSSPETRESAAAMEELLARIQKVIADKHLLERRRALQDGIKKQGDQLAKVKEAIPEIGARVDDMIEQMAAFDRLQLRGYSGTNRDARRVDMTLRAGLKRHEMRLRREQQFSQARCEELEAGRARFQAFLDQQALTDRRLAEHVLTQALLGLQSAGAPGQHGDAACFCTLLRHYLPRAYYSTVTGGCCAGGKAITSSARNSDHSRAAGSSCHGHHGHGVLASREQLWTSLCRVLTSLTWLLFLLLTQPHRVQQTASFILSSLFAIPTYLYRLLAYAIFCLRLRLRLRLGGEAGTRARDAPPPPRLALPAVPPASTLLSTGLALFTLYAWLSYVAVTVERRIWVGDNDWRFAYVLDVTSGRPLPYPGWSPLRVDFRLATDPAWVWFEEAVHSLWTWERRGVDLVSDGAGAGGRSGGGGGVEGMVVGRFARLWELAKA
ncbi:hypothetical protein L209DRAFT_758814 [Thermothelomyces heterothallicus CBS 203.75]